MIEKIFESNYEELDKYMKEKISKNIKKINKNKIEIIKEKIKNKTIRKEIDKELKKIEDFNNKKNLIIMKEMYKKGFKDGIKLIIEIK